MKITLLLIFTLIMSFQVSADEKEALNLKPETIVTGQTLKIEEIPNLHIDLNSPTNWYILLLPLITISLVIGSTIVTVKTITNKTNESKHSFSESLKIQREISEIEVRAKVLSSSRQEWINTLRDELSEFISILHNIQIHLDLKSKAPASIEFGKLLARSELKAAKIYLLINPKEKDHKELVKLIEEALDITGKGYKELYDISEKIISMSQKILKDEWNVLKNFK